MRRFTELCLKSEVPYELVSAALVLGYSSIGLTQGVEEEDIEIVKRLDLDPRNPNDLVRSLRGSRWNNEVITVNCRTKSVARQAGKDNRVDLITFPVTENWKQNSLDSQQANLMRDSGCGYLIDLSELLTENRLVLGKRIEFLKRNAKNALKRGLPVVASSCAVDKSGIRDPYGLASLLSLLDIDEDHALEMISDTPNKIVTQNREKLKDSYTLPGVWIED